MNKHENFWIVTILRGILAVLIGSALLIVPDMARTLLFLPFAVAFVILSLVVYGIVDSLLVFITSFFTHLRPAKTALRLQSALGIAIGILFCSMLFDRIQLEWFLYLIALQATATAFSELTIARHTSKRHGSRSSYTAAIVAMLCAAAYASAALIAPEELTPREIAILAYAYLAAFGVAQVLMSTRMLYLEHHGDPLVHAASQ
ncbi:MAG TPA: hypothetical protein VF865_08575 [Acidobacteriaceae bacterium]